MTQAEDLKGWLKKKAPLSGIALAAFIFLFFTNLSLVVHEVSHTLLARLLGCQASISNLAMFAGATSIKNCADSNLVWVALAGPIGALAYASYLYFSSKDGLLRLAGMISIFYSVLPSLGPMMNGSDMSKAIQYGFNPILGGAMFFGVSGYFTYQFLREITERENPLQTAEL